MCPDETTAHDNVVICKYKCCRSDASNATGLHVWNLAQWFQARTAFHRMQTAKFRWLVDYISHWPMQDNYITASAYKDVVRIHILFLKFFVF